MNDKRYQFTLYLILVVIVTTIGIQVYWNYNNYLSSKQQLINDVQISLDKAVDDYYGNLAKRTTVGFSFLDTNQENVLGKGGELEKVLSQLKENEKEFKGLDSLEINISEGIEVFTGFSADSMMLSKSGKKNDIRTSAKIKHINLDSDSSKVSDLKILTSKVMVSINNDSLDLKSLDSILKLELNRKQLTIDYKLDFESFAFRTIEDTLIREIPTRLRESHPLNTVSKSTFLPEGSLLKINFSNETLLILKRIFSGILISTLLILAVISSLFYLLRIIKQQKQLAEVKNDLISNITHEFKTPIATIGVALESIKDFNGIDDKERTKSYLNMSNQQLDKLNTMVEKLLETATLDSENLELNKESVNIIELVEQIIAKHRLQIEKKTLNINSKQDIILANVDVFHFDNAINNIIDNAIKYGGPNITVELTQNSSAFNIAVSDDGKSLAKANKERIFEKFYRVPKGNTHDVKGFGIGLYYTKTIVEKHNGTIQLDLKKNLTTFNVAIPNE